MKIIHAVTGLPMEGIVGSMAERNYYVTANVTGKLPKYYSRIWKDDQSAAKEAEIRESEFDSDYPAPLVRWIAYYKQEMEKRNTVKLFFYSKEEYNRLIATGEW